ncbi:MAG: hypothetical protein FJ297_08435 [Planctomycetes bacterium]|nr:hypothetical protein [Planctomycetota bacterium]
MGARRCARRAVSPSNSLSSDGLVASRASRVVSPSPARPPRRPRRRRRRRFRPPSLASESASSLRVPSSRSTSPGSRSSARSRSGAGPISKASSA